MILIANKSKVNNKFMTFTSIQESEEKVRANAKKQLIEEILNSPESLKAYKNLELYKIAEIDENMEISNTEHKKLFDYGEIIDEIVDILTKEQKNNGQENNI